MMLGEEVAFGWLFALYGLLAVIFVIPFVILLYIGLKAFSGIKDNLVMDKDYIKEARETSRRFFENINNLMETWVEDKRKEK
jgi:hypothetical protein